MFCVDKEEETISFWSCVLKELEKRWGLLRVIATRGNILSHSVQMSVSKLSHVLNSSSESQS